MQAAQQIRCLTRNASYCKRLARRRELPYLRKFVSKHTVAYNYSSVAQDVIPPPHADITSKVYHPKIQKLVGDISQLTLLEVSDLNELLKKTLNIQDAPMMAMNAVPMTSAKVEEDEEAAPKREKTIFTVKLIKFDAGKKVQLIKEIKNLIEGLNLVQAKKFVESTPQVVRADIPKEEAEKLKEALVAAGAEVEIE